MYMFSDDIFSTTSDRMITELKHLLTSPQNTCWCLDTEAGTIGGMNQPHTMRPQIT